MPLLGIRGSAAPRRCRAVRLLQGRRTVGLCALAWLTILAAPALAQSLVAPTNSIVQPTNARSADALPPDASPYAVNTAATPPVNREPLLTPMGNVDARNSLLVAPPEGSPYVPSAPQGQPGEGVVSLAPGQEMVVDVQIEGNQTLTKEKVLAHIRTRPGRPYDTHLIEEDVRALNRSRLFTWVRPKTQSVPGGRIVIFEVHEQSTIRDVKIIGTEQVRRTVISREAKPPKVGDPADPFAVEEGRRAIEDYYRRKGFGKAQVTIYEGDKPGDQRVVYIIDEGPKQKVLWVNFVGNTIASGGRLMTQVNLKPPLLYLFGGEVDEKKIQEDEEKLTAYYRGLGFFSAVIKCEPSYSESGKWLSLTYVIKEGPRYQVRNVAVIGNTKFDTATLMTEQKLHSNEFFNQSKMDADVAAIKDKYGSDGYVFADVEAQPRFLDEPGKIDLVYHVTEGARYRVGRIDVQIKGEYPHTRLSTVLNQMSLKPGDIVDIRKLRESEKRLKGSGLFLADPSTGDAPKIVFSPPDKDDTQVAERPNGRGHSRSQSPDDDAVPVVVRVIAPPLVPEAKTQPTRAGGNGDAPVGSRPKSKSVYDAPPPADAPPSGNAAPPVPPQTNASPLVVRGQYTSATDYSGGGSQSYAQWVQQQEAARRAAALPAPAGYGAPPYAASGYPAAGAAAPYSANPYYASGQQAQGTTAGAAPMPPAASATAPTIRSVVPVQSGSFAAAAPVAPITNATAAPGSAGTAAYAAQQGYAAAPQTAAPLTPYAAPATGAYTPSGPVGGSGSGTSAMPAAPAQGGYVAPNGAYAQSAAPGQAFSAAPAPQGAPWQRPFGNNLYTPGGPFSDATPNDALRDLDLTVNTAETQTGRLMLGVGVNSDAGLTGQFTLDEQNFDWTRFPRGWEDIRNATAWRGAGQRFRLEAMPGTEVQRYMATFQEPYLFNSEVALGLSGFYYDRLYTEYDENRVGGRVSLGYHLSRHLTVSGAFRGESVGIRNPINPTLPDLAEVVGNNTLLGASFSIAHDTRDNAFLPTEGHLIEFSFEQVFGSFQYPRAELEMRQYFLLHERPDGSGRHVLSIGGRAAASGDDTPIYDRYYAGGFSTIRGFNFRGVSPVKEGVRVGGDFMLLASAEYLFPISADDMLRGVVFCDTGTVEPTIQNWNDNYRVAPGFGLRIVIPAMGPAPIALDFAFPVSREKSDQDQVFSFWLGFLR